MSGQRGEALNFLVGLGVLIQFREGIEGSPPAALAKKSSICPATCSV